MSDDTSTTDAAVTETELDATPLSAAQLEEARRYGHTQLVCMLVDKALDLSWLSVMALVVAVPLDGWLKQYVAADTLRLVVFFLIGMLAHELISVSLTFYREHVLERRYQMSNQSFRQWLSRHLKHLALAVVFGTVMWTGLYWIIWTVGPWWWLVAAGVFFVVSIVLGQLAPVLILPLFYKIERLDDPRLADCMQRLTAGTGLSIEGVYRMKLSDETRKANAMLTGMGSTRRVLMGDTLLDQFTTDEIEVIFAHEVGHHVHRHLPKLIAGGLVMVTAGFWVSDLVLRGWVRAVSGNFDYAQLPVYALAMLMLSVTAFFMLIEPLQNVISRRYERQCDRYALQRTGLREAYLSAFRKLARLNKDDPDPHPLEVALFHSHPPISQRLAMAEDP